MIFPQSGRDFQVSNFWAQNKFSGGCRWPSRKATRTNLGTVGHGWLLSGHYFFWWPTWLGIPPNGGSKYGKNAERRIQVCWWVSPLLSEPPFSVVVWPIGFKYLPPTWRKWCKMRNICFQCVAKKSGHELILCFFASPLSGDAIVFSLWISERKQQRHAKTTTLSKLPLNYIPRESKDQTLPIGW